MRKLRLVEKDGKGEIEEREEEHEVLGEVEKERY